jgi:membrane-bound inhibitor of C-type lysozyme
MKRDSFFPNWLPFFMRTKAACTLALPALFSVCIAYASDLTIHLPDDPSISRQTVEYQCDATGSRIGVPSSSFTVEYINAGGNSLAVVPIAGNALIFANVAAGSGARYAAQQYVWWEAKGAATLYADSLTGKLQSACHRVRK